MVRLGASYSGIQLQELELALKNKIVKKNFNPNGQQYNKRNNSNQPNDIKYVGLHKVDQWSQFAQSPLC